MQKFQVLVAQSPSSLGVNSGEALVQAMKTGQLALQRARAMKTDPSVAWIEPRFLSCQNPPKQPETRIIRNILDEDI